MPSKNFEATFDRRKIEPEAKEPGAFTTEEAHIFDLKPHPGNYKVHPEHQLEHIAASIKEHGFYRPIVTSEDGTILAGHGVVLAAKRLGLEIVPIRRLSIAWDDPRALKVLAGDNEISHLANVDDKALATILSTIMADDSSNLIGTGFDDASLKNLIAVSGLHGTPTENDPSKEWVGMPEFEQKDNFGAILTLKVHFANEEAIEAFAKLLGQSVNVKSTFIWYPKQYNMDNQGRAYVHDA